MKKSLLRSSIAIASVFSAQAYGCGIEGSVVNSDGCKVDGSSTISTSCNSKKAYPRNGSYSLDLGSSVGGSQLTVKGWTTVNYVRR